MKQVRVSLPSDKVNIIQEIEAILGVSFEISVFGDHTVLHFSIDDNQTAKIIEELKGVGVGKVFGKITLSPISFELNSTKEKVILQEKGRGISLDEMISNIKGLALPSWIFLVLSLVAGTLVAFGLLVNNVVIIIASMIIAPLLGPIALSVLGTMLPKNPYRTKAILAEIIGLSSCLAVGIAVGYFWPVPESHELNFQMASRTVPTLVDIFFAILSGVAASIFIIRGESSNLVGVAVAASLCPPVTNVGLLIAFGIKSLDVTFIMLALGSGLLVLLNVASIYCACAIIFWISQSYVRGGTLSSRQFDRISKKYVIQILIAIGILTTIILGIIIFPQTGFFA